MYDKLLLTTGGGIIDRMQQSEQDGSAVVAIGLGGTGIDCLRSLKKQMYNRIKPDDPTATIPQYSHIRFIAVDTDMKDMKKKTSAASRESSDGSLGEIDYDKEFFDISYAEKISELYHSKEKVLAKDPALKEWLQFKQIKAGAADDGAGGIRQLGRFLLMQKAKAFVSRVEQAVKDAKRGLGDCRVYVHIFSGMSGGTGAGTFLDACYLVQRALSDTGTTKSKTLGYFFLPDVNLEKPGISDETKSYIMQNGYASMQELDYCMNFENNGDCWHQEYPGVGEIRTTKPPVEYCHLISGTTSDGAVIPEAYQYAMNVVTDYVMDFLVKSEGDSFTLESHFSNITKNKELVQKRSGAAYDYLVLGAACTLVPFKQVLTYLASKVFEGFAGVRNLVPPNEQSAVFQKTIGFTFDAMLQRLNQGVNMAFPLPDLKAKDVHDSTELLISPLHDAQAAAEGALARNYTALSQPLQSYEQVLTGTASNVQSVMGIVLNAVREAMADPNRGPYYAAQLVQGLGGSDLLAAAEGIRAEAVSRRDHEQYQIDSHAYRDYEQKEREFQAAGFLKLGGAYKDYANAARQLVVFQTRVKMYQTLVDLMDTVKDQLRVMANNFTTPFTTTVTGLFDTFEANRAELEAFADKQNPYEMPLITMQELMPSLNETVRQMDIPSQAHELLEALLSPNGLKGWGPNGDEAYLSHMVSDYFIDKFSAFSSRSLESFLKDKYQTQDADKLAQIVCEDLLQSVNENAAPLFWTETGYTVDDACGIGYLTIPQSAPVVIDAAMRLADSDKTFSVRKTGVRDRISILRCLLGVPMWGYKGVAQYESDSVQNPSVGKHLYERAEYVDGLPEIKDSRDWNLLPSPTPLSMMTDRNDATLQERAERAKVLFEQALKAGIIEKTSSAYEIRVITDSYMQRFRTDFDAAKDQPNDVKIDAQTKLKAMSDNREYEPNKRVLSSEFSTDTQNELDICIDNLAKAPELQKLVKAEMDKNKEIEDDIKALEPKIDDDFSDFTNALFTGVIELHIPKVVYVDPEFGDETVLSDKRMKPYGGVPLYQAYKTFKELDPEVRSSIRTAVQEILDADETPESVETACQAASKELGRAKDIVKVATAFFPREVPEVKAQIKNLKKALELFALENFITL
ncbi:tubulin-like doman-containing protein [Bifidobacterium callimiconis]|uniref:Tubulin like n=1 Tax=Bifidobacterium callimiconis TaxID=2306973 RepID=A0A430FC39_9BIFI|nr:tubulin-like doman-containing protein [Bifidobacterium callimiconis]RSX50371.1 Tubulin like [Bifidobacterium callimiconis]